MLRFLAYAAVYTCLLQQLGDMRTWAALPNPQLPLVSIALTVQEDARDELVALLKQFAEANSFATRVVHPRNEKQHYLIELWRGDVHITIVNPFKDASEFSVFIYQTDAAVSIAHVDSLVGDIQNVLNKIQGVTINAVKR